MLTNHVAHHVQGQGTQTGKAASRVVGQGHGVHAEGRAPKVMGVAQTDRQERLRPLAPWRARDLHRFV